MLRANNNDVRAALAATINCRDSRRGRKPSWNILITTSDNGTVRIIDLARGGCSQVVGKRAYTKKVRFEKRVKKVVEEQVKVVGDTTVRISPVTGKPVRAYKKRTTSVEPTPTLSEKAEKSYVEDVTECLANLRVDVEKAKLAKEAANLTGNHKTVKMLDTIITGLGAKVKEMEAKLAAVQ